MHLLLPTAPHPRTVLVTGASSGIGRAVARELARRGNALVLLARRSERLDELGQECRDLGSRHVVVTPGDVCDVQDLEDAFTSGTAGAGPVDSVIHAAGVAAYGRFEEIPQHVFDRVVQVNVSGTANVARASFRYFDRHGLSGNLILFGSVVGRISTPFLSPYVASKWAVHGLARTLQAEQGHGHRISLVEPGGVRTSIYEKAASYLGVQGKPPPPVADPDRVARVTVALLTHPRRERSVGALNPLISLGFRMLPAVYDRIVGPLMGRLALASDPVADHTGNLFDPAPEPEDTPARVEEHA